MSARALRRLFAVYVLLLCALAISDESMERGGALLVLVIGLTILVRDFDLGVIDDSGDDDPGNWGEENDTAIDD